MNWRDGVPPEQLRAFEIFHPYATRRYDECSEQTRFVHYTTADVAASIIQKKEVWMRNAINMNDFSELEHGRICLVTAWRDGDVGRDFQALLEEISPGICDVVSKHFDGWTPNLQARTYLTCISKHRPEENSHGRLSMWRAYGRASGVALVLNPTPFMAGSGKGEFYSSPVAYLDPEGFAREMRQVVERVAEARAFLAELGREMLWALLDKMFTTAMICTKHPGFEEEAEWRIVYTPDRLRSDVIREEVEVVRGAPELVQKLPLRHDPERGLTGADLPNLLDRLIIGPTNGQLSLRHAFHKLLADAGVPKPWERITASGIPLRHQ
jgi:hypothetical protein